MKFLLVLIVATTLAAMSRPVVSSDMQSLMTNSALVFVGKVKSITPSGITTTLSYPTWRDTTFEWLQVDVEVIEAIKGTTKGQTIRTMMLSTRGFGPIINPPSMVRPQVAQYHLHCLLPSDRHGSFASITGPFDDQEGIFLLDRKSWTEGSTYYKKGRVVAFRHQNDKNAALWNLINAKGKILPKGAEAIRKKYRTQINTPAPQSAISHLTWKKVNHRDGWQWDVPTASSSKSVIPDKIDPKKASALPLKRRKWRNKRKHLW